MKLYVHAVPWTVSSEVAITSKHFRLPAGTNSTMSREVRSHQVMTSAWCGQKPNRHQLETSHVFISTINLLVSFVC